MKCRYILPYRETYGKIVQCAAIVCLCLCSFVNHAIYWAVMSPNPNGTERFPVGKLLDEIETTFGSYQAFKVQFSTAAVDVFGSGTCVILSRPCQLRILLTVIVCNCFVCFVIVLFFSFICLQRGKMTTKAEYDSVNMVNNDVYDGL